MGLQIQKSDNGGVKGEQGIGNGAGKIQGNMWGNSCWIWWSEVPLDLPNEPSCVGWSRGRNTQSNAQKWFHGWSHVACAHNFEAVWFSVSSGTISRAETKTVWNFKRSQLAAKLEDWECLMWTLSNFNTGLKRIECRWIVECFLTCFTVNGKSAVTNFESSV